MTPSAPITSPSPGQPLTSLASLTLWVRVCPQVTVTSGGCAAAGATEKAIADVTIRAADLAAMRMFVLPFDSQRTTRRYGALAARARGTTLAATRDVPTMEQPGMGTSSMRHRVAGRTVRV